ncbi:MAG: PIN domain-containing protein [Paracoccus sp. (in: a-proteobacteria)]|nr:PIN domain-containing protein [Paracoccus sp. (in: a-proteobacteria)]
MRVFLDACVLFPTVMREMLIEVADLYEPLWSQAVLDEWQHSVSARLGPVAGEIARAEIALLRARFPQALVLGEGAKDGALAGVRLPDEGDRHVIAAAMGGQAELILTENRRDFPRRMLAPLGLEVRAPDEFLAALMRDHPDRVLEAARLVHQRAVDAGGEITPRALFKRAGLPRLGRALG